MIEFFEMSLGISLGMATALAIPLIAIVAFLAFQISYSFHNPTRNYSLPTDDFCGGWIEWKSGCSLLCEKARMTMAKTKSRLPRELRGKKLSHDQMMKYYPERWCPSCGTWCCTAFHIQKFGGAGGKDDQDSSRTRRFFGSTAGAIWTIGAGIMAAAAIFIYQNGINAENMEEFLKEQAAEKAAETAVEAVSQVPVILDPSEQSPEPEGTEDEWATESFDSMLASDTANTTETELATSLAESQIKSTVLAFRKVNRTDAELGLEAAKIPGEKPYVVMPQLKPQVARAIKQIKAQTPEWKIAQLNGTPFPAGDDITGNYPEPTAGEPGTAGQVRGRTTRDVGQPQVDNIDTLNDRLIAEGLDPIRIGGSQPASPDSLDDDPVEASPFIGKALASIPILLLVFVWATGRRRR